MSYGPRVARGAGLGGLERPLRSGRSDTRSRNAPDAELPRVGRGAGTRKCCRIAQRWPRRGTIAFVDARRRRGAARPARHKASHAQLAAGLDMLFRLLGGARRPDWAWFEARARLRQPAAQPGADRGRHRAARATTTSTPGWRRSSGSPKQQTASNGQFRPIGCGSFGKPHSHYPFDQQPLEAQAAIEAALTAWNATADPALVRSRQGGVGVVLRCQRPRCGTRRPRHRPLPRRDHPARRERELRRRIDSRLSTRPLFHASARPLTAERISGR
jgi:hypothetical protein